MPPWSKEPGPGPERTSFWHRATPLSCSAAGTVGTHPIEMAARDR
jgi:hypothetical protein